MKQLGIKILNPKQYVTRDEVAKTLHKLSFSNVEVADTLKKYGYLQQLYTYGMVKQDEQLLKLLMFYDRVEQKDDSLVFYINDSEKSYHIFQGIFVPIEVNVKSESDKMTLNVYQQPLPNFEKNLYMTKIYELKEKEKNE